MLAAGYEPVCRRKKRIGGFDAVRCEGVTNHIRCFLMSWVIRRKKTALKLKD